MSARISGLAASGLLLIGLALFGARPGGPLARAEHAHVASPSARVSATPPEAEIEFAGCALLRHAHQCELDDARQLVIWYASTPGPALRYAFDAQPLAPLARLARRNPSAEGFQATLTAPSHARVLRVFRGNALALELNLANHRGFAWQGRADALRAEGNVEQARALAEQAGTSRDLEERNRARALLARLARVSGNAERAAQELAQTAEEAWRLGRASDAVSDALACAYIEIIHLGRLAPAQRILERARQFVEADVSGRGDWYYFSGLLARSRGELWAAGRFYREAARLNARLGLQAGFRDAGAQLAEVYAELGQFQLAQELLDEVVQSSADQPACVRGSVYTHLAWIGMLASERGYPSDDIERALAQARELNDRCGAPRARRVDRINAGLWAARAGGDLTSARARYAELASVEGEPPNDLRFWQLELIGRIRLAERVPSAALTAFEQQLGVARELGNDDAEARALVNAGTALERLGQVRRALGAYREAEVLFERTSVPIGVARDGYFGVRDGALVRLLDSQVALGRASEAFESALSAYRRGLAWHSGVDRLDRLDGHAMDSWRRAVATYLGARGEATRNADQDWRLARDEIEALAADRSERTRRAVDELYARAMELGIVAPFARAELPQTDAELALVVVPAQGGWRIFSRFRGSVRALRVEPPARAPEPDDAWFAPFESELRRARRLLVLPYGAANAIDWSRASAGGKLLVERLEIVQSLATGRSEPRAPGEQARALIVADPASDLPGARADAQQLAQRLASQAPIVLVGEAASRQSVLANLARASLFYYAGHGEPSDLHGTSGLPLAFGERLLPSDVLALPRAPELVVLAACDAGRSLSPVGASGWSLAHAFVLAGARRVVAPVRPVADRAASTLGRALLEHDASDLGAGLAHAARTMHASGLDGWAPFRIYVP